MTPAEARAVAEEAARRAGAELVRRLPQHRTIDFKGGSKGNLVTDADQASEEVLLEFLAREAPGHSIVAEESGAHQGTGVTWYLDPLDGTTNYAHAVPHFSVTLGAELRTAEGASLLAGAVLDPLRGELFSAAAGQGATLNGVPIHASETTALEAALLCTGFPYDVAQHPEAPLGLFLKLVTRSRGMRRMGSAALDLAYIACGRYDGYFEFGLKPWDIAAGALLVQEAGGVCCRVDAAPLDVRFGDVLACAPGLGDELKATCRHFLADIGWTARPSLSAPR